MCNAYIPHLPIGMNGLKLREQTTCLWIPTGAQQRSADEEDDATYALCSRFVCFISVEIRDWTIHLQMLMFGTKLVKITRCAPERAATGRPRVT